MKSDRDVQYRIEDGYLLRTAMSDRARSGSYVHRCTKESFEKVAHAVDEAVACGTTVMLIARQEDLPSTQVNVALEFLKERGLVDVRRRRCYPATRDVYLDAMVEFHVLEEGHQSG